MVKTNKIQKKQKNETNNHKNEREKIMKLYLRERGRHEFSSILF